MRKAIYYLKLNENFLGKKLKKRMFKITKEEKENNAQNYKRVKEIV